MLKDVAPKGRSISVRRARRLRAEMTLPEVLLWQALRSRPKSIEFRRQHPAGPYILDFFCNDARLAIEVDGGSHVMARQAEHDARRDAFFARLGIETLRLPAANILSGFDAVVAHVVDTACARLPLHHAAHGPPPRAKLGEN